MIDTVVLILNQDQFKILDYDRFTPSARGLFEPPFYKLGKSGIIRCHNNPSKKSHRYLPKLTLMKRMASGGYSLSLRVEFSLPKLIYGNNFAEIDPQNLPNLNTLFDSKSLEIMGVSFALPLEKTSVGAVHFCKNIILPKHITSSMVINEIGKVSLTKRLDLNKTDFRNNGHAVKFHANSYEVAFYDKIQDLRQSFISEKCAIETDNHWQQDFLKTLPKDLQVLRMEVRLNTRRKIKCLCERLGQRVPETLSELFHKDLAKAVLLHFWDFVERELKVVNLTRERSENLFQQLVLSGVKPNKALQIVGAMAVIESVGIRGLKSLMTQASYKTWQRIQKEIKNYPSGNSRIQLISLIRKSLAKFSCIESGMSSVPLLEI